jgi:plastocyanin
MRIRSLCFVALLTMASSAFAKDVYLTIGGSIGNFRTDTRVFNPSSTRDISVRAIFLEAGTESNHLNNSRFETSRQITIPRRAMVAYDDVVSAVFGITGKLGAILLTSDDDFEATQRIYAAEAAGTLGQFVPGLSVSEARPKGVVLQLKANGGRGTRGTFRSNVGFVNPVNAVNTVNLRLFDRNNAQVGAVKTMSLQPYGVIAPSNITSLFPVGTADLTDAYMTYDASGPLFAYGSVLDNGTEDPTYVPASPDSGSPLPELPQGPTEKIVNVTLRNWAIDIDPVSIKVGDQVKVLLRSTSGTHGFSMFDPAGRQVVSSGNIVEDAPDKTFSFTATVAGEYGYFCTISTCGVGHNEMVGTLDVTR